MQPSHWSLYIYLIWSNFTLSGLKRNNFLMFFHLNYLCFSWTSLGIHWFLKVFQNIKIYALFLVNCVSSPNLHPEWSCPGNSLIAKLCQGLNQSLARTTIIKAIIKASQHFSNFQESKLPFLHCQPHLSSCDKYIFDDS